MMLRFAALAVVVATIAPLHAAFHSEAGAFVIRTYSPGQYNANGENWSVVQDSRGVLYFGNNDGVLEYDGVTWRRIAVKGQFVRRLAIDSSGTIFVGGRGNLGFLAPDAGGSLRFVSLLDKVPAADRGFNDIWSVSPTTDGVYFASYDRVFRYTTDGKIKVFRPQGRQFAHAFSYHDEFYVVSLDQGLLTMKHGELVASRIPGDDKLLHSLLLFADGAVPLIAYDKKLYRFSLSGIVRFNTAGDAYFGQHEIVAVTQLSSGDIAVGTGSGGLVLLNQAGELERTIRKTDGLPSNSINSIFSDKEGGIWLTGDNGLARLPNNLTHFSEAQGIHGLVYAVSRIGGVLYVGTSLGLFRMHTVPQAEPVFTPVLDVQEEVFTIQDRAGYGFVGTGRSLFVLAGDKFRRILTRDVYDVIASRRKPNIFYAAGGGGVQMLEHSGNDWAVVAKESSGRRDFNSVAEAPDGRVWATATGNVWRVDFSSSPPKSEHFTEADGVPEGWIYVDPFRDRMVFASQRGLLQFVEANKRFVPDTELGERFSDGKSIVSTVREDPFKDVWITGRGYHGVLRGPKLEWFGDPMLEAEKGELYWIYFDPDGTCWAAAGTSGALIRYERPVAQKPGSFDVLLRGAILTNEERTIFRGDGAAQEFRLPHRDNALRFEYAAPFFQDESAVDYQFRLVGSDSKWSAWTKETRKDYTNLFEGKYTFEVRARNPHGVITPAAAYKFTLEAPWYRTWLAYAVYVAGFLFAGWLILRWRLQALEAKNRWLENVVEERTAEVRTERDQNEALLLNILPKPVASELRETGSVKPTSFDDVTVCFSDFVGFTLSSEKLAPQELISSLNEYFTAFDEIIGRYGLEKLKTIGDAYMFAGGLPNASPSHAVDSVLAALEMVEVVQRLARPDKGVNWSIRLGLYSGPVVAGVVGVRKFAFDIWGNTVNFAARMESAGSANRVNLSETTSQRVANFIDCEPRGPVKIKEGREMEMFFALNPRAELLAGPLVDGIPEAFRVRYEKAFSKPPKAFPNLNGHNGN